MYCIGKYILKTNRLQDYVDYGFVIKAIKQTIEII